MLVKTHIINFLCLSVLLLPAKSQPSFSSATMIGGMKVYRDLKQADLYYYAPFDYRLVTDPAGKPDLSLIEMRYTGTKATGDAGTAKYSNLLRFRIAADLSQAQKIAEVKTILKKGSPAAELHMLPVRKFSSVLVFAATANLENADSMRIIKTGYAEATDRDSEDNNSYWNDRIVTLRLNDFDAQLVEAALRNQQSVMSFSYALYTSFSETDFSDLDVTGDNKIRKEIADIFKKEVGNQKDSTMAIRLIKAEAIALNMNANRWPEAVQKIDINEKVPARYPLFDVYCYDFENELRPDLYLKKIEIKATSVNGSEVCTDFYFRASEPDVYATSIRFMYAVRFDKPFYYRVTEFSLEGESVATGWIEKNNWNELLNITSTPDKITKRTVGDQ